LSRLGRVLLVVVGGLLWGCPSQHKPERPECSEAALALITADCNARRELECKNLSDEDCPVVAECDKRIDKWEKCQ
jgi:hypothetical protein